MLLLQLVRESRENDADNYDNGTESEEEIAYRPGRLDAYVSFSSYHIDFTAVLFVNMNFLERKPVVRYAAKTLGGIPMETGKLSIPFRRK